MLTPLQKRLLNDYQHDFPLTATPYQDIADQLGVSEDEVFKAFNQLNDANYISRIGSVIPPNHIGVSTLAAMQVPAEQLAKVAQIINRYPEVNHNYEREHDYNLWFVVIANNEQHLQSVIAEIEQATGFNAMQLPMLDDFFIDLGFNLNLSHD